MVDNSPCKFVSHTGSDTSTEPYRTKPTKMLRLLVLCDDKMLFQLCVARFLTVVQLGNLCRTSKDFCGMLIPRVPFSRDLQDEHLQDAFVVRLVNAKNGK